LHSELHVCKSSALPLEPSLQPFLLWLFWRCGLTFCSGWPGPWSSYFLLPAIARMTGNHNQAQFFSVQMGCHKFFCPGWPRTVLLLISASHVPWDDGLPFPAVGWDRSSWSFWPRWPQAAILLMSASQGARIIGMTHWHSAYF
jgi:hypothetical protein